MPFSRAETGLQLHEAFTKKQHQVTAINVKVSMTSFYDCYSAGMTPIQIHNHENMIAMWSAVVDRLRVDLDHAPPYSSSMRSSLRSDFRVYGCCLARTRRRLEEALGIQSMSRDAAGDAYLIAMQRVTEILQEGESGAIIGSLAFRMPTLAMSWEERREQAETLADVAMLSWCSE